MDEMQKLNMDTVQLEEKIHNLDELNRALLNHFETIKSLMDSIKGEWESNTATQVFDNFDKALEIMQRIGLQRSNDFKFLQNSYDNYQSMEQSIDSLVEEKVAIAEKNFFSDSDKQAKVDYSSGLNQDLVTVKKDENTVVGSNPPTSSN